MTNPLRKELNHPFEIVIALSGGLDSMTVLESLRRNRRCAALHVDVGGPASYAQRKACERYCMQHDIPLEVLEMKASQSVPIQQTTNDGLGLMCLLTLVATFSHAICCQKIAIGLTLEQRTFFDTWLDRWKTLFFACVGTEMQIATPLAALTKTEVVQRAAELGLRASDSWSCTVQSLVACGHCDACRDRDRAEIVARSHFGKLVNYF